MALEGVEIIVDGKQRPEPPRGCLTSLLRALLIVALLAVIAITLAVLLLWLAIATGNFELAS